MKTVQPISGRKTGELCRLLEERERGDSDFQKLVEHPGDVVVLIDAIKARESKLLEPVTSVSLPAIETFSASDHFRVGEVEGVKIGWLGDNFKRVFGKKVEQSVAKATLRIHRLRQASLDGPIIAELGGEAVAETTLAQMFEMMKAQGHGQPGNLHADGYANIFYIRADDGQLWAVVCDWDSCYGGWSVAADPFSAPSEWDVGSQVVSR